MWKHGLLGLRNAKSASKARLLTVDGRTIEVIYPGRHNIDSGPDFLGARIRIGDEEWAGNIEIHVKASDWHRHNHHLDSAFNNVILHVVGVNDTQVKDFRGCVIPQTVISFPESFISLYSRLSENIYASPCEPGLKNLNPLTRAGWIETLSVERMQQKAARILDTLKFTDGDWERTCFVSLARALGFSLNSEPLEILARSLPLSTVAKHSDNMLQIEALLFGQAGMLDSSVHIFDEYYQQLCREYFFLARKYGLKPMRRDLWKFARTRPQNFPTRRIALLAKTLYNGFSLFSSIIENKDNIEKLKTLFDWEIDGYWDTHLDFDQTGYKLSASLSEGAIRLLNINLTGPMLYAYGGWRGDVDMAERGMDVWHEELPENNTVTRRWTAAGIDCDNASDSQGLLQLKKEYCDRNRCLDCRFGHALLREAYHNDL